MDSLSFLGHDSKAARSTFFAEFQFARVRCGSNDPSLLVRYNQSFHGLIFVYSNTPITIMK